MAKSFVVGDGLETTQVLIEAGEDLSKQISEKIVELAEDLHRLSVDKLKAARVDSSGMELSAEDRALFDAATENQRIAAGLLLMLNILLQMVESGGPAMQMTAIASIAAEVTGWKNDKEMKFSEILQALLQTSTPGVKLN